MFCHQTRVSRVRTAREGSARRCALYKSERRQILGETAPGKRRRGVQHMPCGWRFASRPPPSTFDPAARQRVHYISKGVWQWCKYGFETNGSAETADNVSSDLCAAFKSRSILIRVTLESERPQSAITLQLNVICRRAYAASPSYERWALVDSTLPQ